MSKNQKIATLLSKTFFENLNSNRYITHSRSKWPRGLRRGSAAARLQGLRVWISPGAWMSVSCGCCMLSGRGLCVGLIPRPERSYRVWCVWVWSWSLDSEALAHEGLSWQEKKNILTPLLLQWYGLLVQCCALFPECFGESRGASVWRLLVVHVKGWILAFKAIWKKSSRM
jgi:hypothetical protein